MQTFGQTIGHLQCRQVPLQLLQIMAQPYPSAQILLPEAIPHAQAAPTLAGLITEVMVICVQIQILAILSPIGPVLVLGAMPAQLAVFLLLFTIQ